MRARPLLHVIDGVLDFSKIEAGRLELEEVPFRPAEIVRLAVSLVELQARDKGLEVTTDIPPELDDLVVVADAGRLQQVLLNLLGNALKFTDEGSIRLGLQVEAVGEEGDRRLAFRVEDSGMGIPADRLEANFESFEQGELSTPRRFGGSGLGLAICRRIVERMGGTIAVESEPGRGSTFRFDIRARPGSLPEIETAGAGSEEIRPLRILLADDSDDSRFVIESYLAPTPHFVVAATDGLEAFEALKGGGFDLALLDLQMPGLTGVEAIRRVRAWEEEQGTGPVPIVVLTGFTLRESEDECRRAGCSGFLTKPIKRGVLLGAIHRYAGGEAPGPVLEGWLDEGAAEELAMRMRSFGERIPRRVVTIRRLWADILEGSGPSSTRFDVEVHSLAGTAGSFGWTAVGNAARVLDEAIWRWRSEADSASPEARATIEEALAALETEAALLQKSTGADG